MYAVKAFTKKFDLELYYARWVRIALQDSKMKVLDLKLAFSDGKGRFLHHFRKVKVLTKKVNFDQKSQSLTQNGQMCSSINF